MDHQQKAHQYLHNQTSNEEDYSYEPSSTFVTNDAQSNPFDLNDSGSWPECFWISLPLGMAQDMCQELRLRDIVDIEIQLRIGQCHDALKAIRLAMGKKGFLFHTKIRPKGPKTGKTKSWDSIHALDQTLRLQAQIY
jgi:hypothetical protein